MEFGLQKNEKMGSPVLVGNPRKRIEAKAYRARDRMDNGWFRHDAVTPESSPNASPMASPLRSGGGGRSQEVLGNLPPVCVHCCCPKQPDKQQITAARSESAARFQQQIYPNCSHWYRHEHTIIASDSDEEQRNGKEQCFSPTPTWWHSDETAGQSSPRSRRVCAEADAYWKRNHDGSAKDWYRHEHTLVEEKENECPDVSGKVLSGDADPIIPATGHRCHICGGINAD